MALTKKKQKKVTSTITLSLSRLVFKFTGLVGNTLYGCLEKKKCTGCRGCIQHTHKDTAVSNSTILKHCFILNRSLLFLDTVPSLMVKP